MDKEIKEILQKQQELEYLKSLDASSFKRNRDAVSPVSSYGEQVLKQCRDYNRRLNHKKLQRSLTVSLCICLLLFTIAYTLRIRLIDFGYLPDSTHLSDSENLAEVPLTEKDFESLSSAEKAYWESYSGRAEIEMTKENFDEAEKIIKEGIEEYPNGFAIYLTYSRLCQKEQNFDKAADIIIEFIEMKLGVKNIAEGSPLYKELKNINGPFSPEMEKKYQKCIADCEESISFYQSLNSLLEDKRYQPVLDLCDFRKQAGASDSTLYYYYTSAYEGLGKYEECAAYLLELAGQAKDQEDYPLHLPAEPLIRNHLEGLESNVSEDTAAEIKSACEWLS